MSALNPIKAFQHWYSNLPDEACGDIAAWVLTFHPTRVDETPGRELVEARKVFQEWLSHDNARAYRVVGKILHIRSVMDFFLIRRFGDAHDWEQKKELNEDMIAGFVKEGKADLAEVLRDGMERFPERERLWREVADSWKRFSNTSISFEVMEAWLEEEMRKY